ncbi:leucine-rich repeat domain-containing protein [Thermospira aquatica]|uniref:Leucine-rich repeat domain-containing protein n=1 Tax=Thermospira aquatica TaxID=2828656 RepID=A0AAX3BCA1_9SPIR|nr:leucine-rich repeat domain-containing protein [Thermospira aquatica]URA09863.1 leucine-rich repeat domain-containing protein [Thermospira aquatica]
MKMIPIANQYYSSESRELFLSHMGLTKIEDMSVFQRLERLWLDHNDITEISGLDNLPNLIGLKLSYNKIDEIKNLRLPKLKWLYLDHNRITRIQSLEFLPSLELLYLDGNPIKSIDKNTYDFLYQKRVIFMNDRGAEHCVKKIVSSHRITSL